MKYGLYLLSVCDEINQRNKTVNRIDKSILILLRDVEDSSYKLQVYSKSKRVGLFKTLTGMNV